MVSRLNSVRLHVKYCSFYCVLNYKDLDMTTRTLLIFLCTSSLLTLFVWGLIQLNINWSWLFTTLKYAGGALVVIAVFVALLISYCARTDDTEIKKQRLFDELKARQKK